MFHVKHNFKMKDDESVISGRILQPENARQVNTGRYRLPDGAMVPSVMQEDDALPSQLDGEV